MPEGSDLGEAREGQEVKGTENMAWKVNEEILAQIDELKLGGRLADWRKAMKEATYQMYPDRQILFMESWRETKGQDIEVRRAKALKHICENIPISILPWEVIVGKATPGVVGATPGFDVNGDYMPSIWEDDEEVAIGWDNKATLTKEEKDILREAAVTFREENVASMTIDAVRAAVGDWHDNACKACVVDPDYDAVLFGSITGSCDFKYIINNGLGSYIERADRYIEAERRKHRPNTDRIYFWEASKLCMEGIIALAHRYSELASQLADECDDPARAEQLRGIAEVCSKVPERPATSLQEALTAMAITGCGKVYEHPTHNYPHWGRGDQYLYPFFINDIESGKITVEDAFQMVGELYGRWGTCLAINPGSMQESHQVNFGINALSLGGYGQNYEDMSNELSALFLKVSGQLCISSPTVSIRWTEKTPDWLMKRAIECNMATRGGIPLFQNDMRTIGQYLENGIPWSEACEWFGLGCVYPTLPTRAEHYGMEGMAGVNLAAMLDMALHNGRDCHGKLTGVDCGDAVDFQSIDEIKEALFAQHKRVMDGVVKCAHIALDVQPRYFRMPFWSTICIPYYFADGRDLLFPDEEMTMFGFSDRAIIDVADSLMAIKHLVFDEKKLTMAELMEALDSDFAGERGEEIRQMCLAAPKFGNDIDEVDMLVSEISDRSAGYIKGMDNSPFRNFIITREGLSWHFFAGLGVRALPDGRHAFKPLDDGSFSPMGGADKNGPTAVLRSVLKAQQKDAGASVLNQKFTATMLQTEGARDMLVNYTNAFMAAGGSHIQYNIMDTEELKEAKVVPEEHQDLIVRIGGFSAYFVQLSEGIQDDVINRTELAM